MTKHQRAFTYEPKIPAVRDGRCTQTIRPKGKRPIVPGDIILFHGWEGRPYRSPWSWRMERATVKEVIPLKVYPEGFVLNGSIYRPWKSKEGDELAERDFIDPPTGEELGKVLTGMHKGLDGQEFQVIRW